VIVSAKRGGGNKFLWLVEELCVRFCHVLTFCIFCKVGPHNTQQLPTIELGRMA
jgi:hypothetical protein